MPRVNEDGSPVFATIERLPEPQKDLVLVCPYCPRIWVFDGQDSADADAPELVASCSKLPNDIGSSYVQHLQFVHGFTDDEIARAKVAVK